MYTYYIMHNDDMQVRHNHMNLVHNHHLHTYMRLVYLAYDYIDYAYDNRTSRRNHMYKTRCYSRTETRSRRTWFS